MFIQCLCATVPAGVCLCVFLLVQPQGGLCLLRTSLSVHQHKSPWQQRLHCSSLVVGLGSWTPWGPRDSPRMWFTWSEEVRSDIVLYTWQTISWCAPRYCSCPLIRELPLEKLYSVLEINQHHIRMYLILEFHCYFWTHYVRTYITTYVASLFSS